MKQKKGQFLYKQLADQIQGRIEKGSFRLTEKLPSLRVLRQNTGLSMSTVFQAYVELEKRGVIEARPRSGYFIKPRIKRLRHTPTIRHQVIAPQKVNLDDIIHQLTEDLGKPGILKLGGVAVSPEHLPVRQLHKHLKSVPEKAVPSMIVGYTPPQGDEMLRKQISNLLFSIIPSVSMEDIVITNGCTEALSLSLRAVSRPGDTIIVESPADPWLRQTIKDSGMVTLEIPSDPETGLDFDLLKRALDKEKISSCIVNPNCNNPLGFIMPDENKKSMLKLMEQRKIPIIENDVSGELYFRGPRPNPIKKWDSGSTVLYCSSFSKVIAPGLRIGWVLPGRFKASVIRMKLNRSLISPSLNQVLMANYLKAGRFSRHLRRLRETIKIQHDYCAQAIHNYFPETVRMTRPKGGLSIWIELPKKVSGRSVYKESIAKGISILPGFLCTSFNTYDHHIRIGFGGSWNHTMENAIKEIGDIVKRIVEQEL